MKESSVSLATLQLNLDALVTRGMMLPPSAPALDPVHESIASHCAALAAFDAEANRPGSADEVVIKLMQVEHEARWRLLRADPATLSGLQAKLTYTLAFSLPAWRDGGPDDEAIVLLGSVLATLQRLLGASALV